MTETAVILAAGRAERMMPLSAQRLKPMFLLAGKPAIQHALEEAVRIGAKRAIVVVPAGDTTIQAFVGDGNHFELETQFVEQSTGTGTLAALHAARAHVDSDCVVLPGGTFIGAGAAQALSGANKTTVLVAEATATHKQHIPVLRQGQLTKTVHEAPTLRSTRVFTGMMHLDARFMEWLGTQSETSGALEVTLGQYAENEPVRIEDAKGTWEPIVDPWDLVRINEQALADTDVRLGQGTDIHESAILTPPVWIGDGVHIGERAVIGPYVSIRTNARIGPLCEIRHSIINNNVELDTRSVLRRSVVDDGVRVGPGFLAPDGTILGPDATIGSGVIAGAETIVGEGERVPDGQRLGDA